MDNMNKNILNSAHRHFRKNDPIMAELIKRNGAVTLSNSRKPYFHALVSAIISQQLSVKAANTIEKRALALSGGRYFKADSLHKIKPMALRECGLSLNKVRYVQTLALAIIDGQLNFRKLVRKDNETISATLMEYPGIGQWSADIFLITSLKRMDVFPVGDLIIRKSIKHYYGLNDDVKLDKYFSIASQWQPYRTIASFYLWKNKTWL